MDINEFLSIGVVGVSLSLAIEYIKAWKGTDTFGTKVLTLSLSIIVGTIYYFASQTAWWESVLGILAAATAFWAFFIKK